MGQPDLARLRASDLSQTVRAAQQGEPRALEALLTSLRPSLLVMVTRRLPASSAEDLTQLALMRITGALPRIAPERAERYVATVVRNLLRTEYRRRDREARRSVPVELAADVTSPIAVDAQAEYRELALAVHRASEAVLPPALREIVFGLMRGESLIDLAARQHVSPVTIRTRLLRARAILRRELGAHLTTATRAGAR